MHACSMPSVDWLSFRFARGRPVCGFANLLGEEPRYRWRWGRTRPITSWRPALEYVVTGDNSCLMHIGGILHRLKSSVRPIHLAEILASTESDVVSGPTSVTSGPPRPSSGSPRPDPARYAGVPASAETARLATQQRRNLGHATGVIRAKRAAVIAEVPGVGTAAARRSDDGSPAR